MPLFALLFFLFQLFHNPGGGEGESLPNASLKVPLQACLSLRTYSLPNTALVCAVTQVMSSSQNNFQLSTASAMWSLAPQLSSSVPTLKLHIIGKERFPTRNCKIIIRWKFQDNQEIELVKCFTYANFPMEGKV